MSDEKNLTGHPPLSPSAVAGRLAVIGGLLFASALAFAYAGGWLTPDRLTPTRMVAALSDCGGNPLGHRRNHSKGICRGGPGCLNRFSASISGASARVRLPSGVAAG
jgi:catalase